MEFFFHVAPDKQLKREEVQPFAPWRSEDGRPYYGFVIQTRFKYFVTEVYFHNAIKLSDVDSYYLFNMTAVKRKSEQANMPYFSTFLTKLHKMSGNDTTIN